MALCTALLVLAIFAPTSGAMRCTNFTGKWTGDFSNIPLQQRRRQLHGTTTYDDKSSQEYFIIMDDEVDGQLYNTFLVEAVTDLGTGWSGDADGTAAANNGMGRWDDYSSSPESGAWGTGMGKLWPNGTVSPGRVCH
jgi:hypothetical protein